MNIWDTLGERNYKRMRRQHRPLVKYIYDFIKEKEVKSILEVGCGLISQYKDCVKNYKAIDINKNVDAIHEDFTKLEPLTILSLKNKFDLLLACAVIEHCDGYRNFIKNVVDINAKYSIISFFNGLNRKEEYFASETRGMIAHPWNKYSKERIGYFLEEIGVADRSELFRLHRHDCLLIIKGKVK